MAEFVMAISISWRQSSSSSDLLQEQGKFLLSYAAYHASD